MRGFIPCEVKLTQTLETNIGGYLIPARMGDARQGAVMGVESDGEPGGQTGARTRWGQWVGPDKSRVPDRG